MTLAKAEAVAFLQNQPSWDYGKFPQRTGFERQPVPDRVGVLGKVVLGT